MDTAFEILAGQYRPMLLAYARALLNGDEHEAEDVVQETFLAAHERLDHFRTGEDFGRWLRGIARNKVLESHRAARGRKAVVDSRIIDGIEEVYAAFDDPPPGEEAWLERVQRLTRHCVDRLSKNLHDAVVQVYSRGLTLRQAAAVLQLPPAAVAQRVSRARQRIRKCVERHARSES
jgi:RNA polymerase sigma-70 factor (ECF subfamily)